MARYTVPFVIDARAYEILGDKDATDPLFRDALETSDVITLLNALAFAWDDCLPTAGDIATALTRRFGLTDDDLNAFARSEKPAAGSAYERLYEDAWAADRAGQLSRVPTNGGTAVGETPATSTAPIGHSSLVIRHSAPEGAAPFPMSTEITLRPAQDLPDHPLLAGIPVWQASQPEFQALKESIRDRGVDYPVLIDSEGQVVDGRNRRNACAALGIEVPTRLVPDDQIAEVIISSLGCRRHVTKGAMAYLLAPLLKPAVEAARARRMELLKKGESPVVRSVNYGSIEDLADSLGFGRTVLFQALDLHKKFAADNDLRLQFEPKIIEGEIGLGGAIQAIAGKLATEGKEKHTRPADVLIVRAFTDLRNRWQHWTKLPEAKRAEVTAEAVKVAADYPAEVATAMAAQWRKAGII